MECVPPRIGFLYEFENDPIITPKHGKDDYAYDWVCSHKYHSWLHDYVVNMDT
jgi:hypothetical protein